MTRSRRYLPRRTFPRRARATERSSGSAIERIERIRFGRRDARNLSELGRVRVRPEHASEHVADLLLGEVELRCFDDRSHQVLPRFARHANRSESRSDLPGIARRLHLLEIL